MESTSEEFYKRLKKELETSTEWPSEYLFKFIVPTSEEKILKVENAFNQMGAVIDTKESKARKYTSISVNVKMESAQAVVDIYLQLSTVEGIISL